MKTRFKFLDLALICAAAVLLPALSFAQQQLLNVSGHIAGEEPDEPQVTTYEVTAPAAGTMSYSLTGSDSLNLGSGNMSVTANEMVSFSVNKREGETSGGEYTLVVTFTHSQVSPSFTTAPSSTSVPAGSNAIFTVAAAGYPVPTLQWQRLVSGSWQNLSNDASYSGVTTSTLTVATTLPMSGTLFRCVATNSAGTTNSSAATLTVQGPTAPSFATQPQSVSVGAGWDPLESTCRHASLSIL